MKRRSKGKVEGFKIEICEYFAGYMVKHKLEQQALAKRLKLNCALMSKIVRLQYQEFTVDRLLRLLNIIRPDLVPALKKTSKAKKKKRKNS